MSVRMQIRLRDAALQRLQHGAGHCCGDEDLREELDALRADCTHPDVTRFAMENIELRGAPSHYSPSTLFLSVCLSLCLSAMLFLKGLLFVDACYLNDVARCDICFLFCVLRRATKICQTDHSDLETRRRTEVAKLESYIRVCCSVSVVAATGIVFGCKAALLRLCAI